MFIDNISFATKQQKTSGKLQIKQCNRVIDLLDELSGEINYQLSGFLNERNQPTLKISICGIIATLCQICLKNFEINIDSNRLVQIFKNEADLDAALFGEDAIIEDGILADTEFDVVKFIEDELIMTLPLAPKHACCATSSYQDTTNMPFAMLKKMIN